MRPPSRFNLLLVAAALWAIAVAFLLGMGARLAFEAVRAAYSMSQAPR